ncbi:hypothetical protein CN1A_66 [Clavibacter phage CN1A]|uniref:Uncharacterized protein n=1 Tax=Clavibacter phage CN1A TaxID=1406793 RepID=U5PTA2_9CAUD|nr:hypothetical protein CN1A_66 [Clavibacter phage CN1A]AGY47175.1 hypothetical protein CN1A_66 [Clavibacter phage CN1A]
MNRPNTCLFKGCLDSILAKGLCAGHYNQRRAGKDLTAKRPYTKTYNGQECPVRLCHEAQSSIGLCWGHASLARARGVNARRFAQIYVEPVRHRAVVTSLEEETA